MKIIILCAGKGRRFNIDKPKCLLNVSGKSLIKRCINAFKFYGFQDNDFIFASGYKEHLIKKNLQGKFNYVKNKKYKVTNMVYTLFNALQNVYDQDIIVCYADIIFDKKNIKNLINSKKDIVTLIDFEWKKVWKKKNKLLDDSETLKVKGEKIVKMGEKTQDIKNIDARFIGITKISRKYLNKLKFLYKKQLLKNKNYFMKIDMTNFFNYLIKYKESIFFIKNKGLWYEFDDKNDLRNFKKLY